MSNKAYYAHGIVGLLVSLICPIVIWLPYFLNWDWADQLSAGSWFLLLFLCYVCTILTFIHGLWNVWHLEKKSPQSSYIALFFLELIISAVSIVGAVLFVISLMYQLSHM